MSLPLLSKADSQEALSKVYVSAIAARAGFCIIPPTDVDRDSIDLGFAAGGPMRPQLNAQLKATINFPLLGNNFRFSLSKKNYDDLRVPVMVPRILIVLHLPRSENSWMNVSLTRLILKKCAYWTILKGLPELKEGQESVTVDVPSGNCFDVNRLQQLMSEAAQGKL